MRKRTLSREIALQLLYQLEIRGDEIINEIDSFCKEQGKEPDISDFAMTLVHGCIQIMKEIDKKISSTSERWDLHRMPIIDRNILRLACYELLYMDDIPHKVSINEAIDLAKKYSTKKSGLFVNGVLDKVYSHYVKKNEEDRNRTSNLRKDNSLKTNRRTGADLHVHTEYSDGTMSPEQVVDAASKLNLRTIAITDHDNIEAVEIAQDICDKEGMTLVPAVELSSYHSPSDIHILGYFIDLKNNALLGKLSELHIERVERIKKITNKLKGLDVFIDPQEVFDVSGKGAPGRMHIAEVLCKKGYCYNIQECFQKYLSDDGPAYEPKVTLTLEGAIEVIITSGGVPVLAHPNSTRRDDLIPKMVEYGLQGIEVYYHTHQPDVVRKYESLAREYDLIATGGSDFHGERRPDIELGCITIDDNTVEKIKERHNNVLGMLSCK